MKVTTNKMILVTFHPNVPPVGATGEATNPPSRWFHGIYSLDLQSWCPWRGLASTVIMIKVTRDDKRDDFGDFSLECSARGAHWGSTDPPSQLFHGIFNLDMASRCPWRGLVIVFKIAENKGKDERDDFGEIMFRACL